MGQSLHLPQGEGISRIRCGSWALHFTLGWEFIFYLKFIPEIYYLAFSCFHRGPLLGLGLGLLCRVFCYIYVHT